jgi:hypothetical protein
VLFCVPNNSFIKAMLKHKAQRMEYGQFQGKWEIHHSSKLKGILLCLICQQPLWRLLPRNVKELVFLNLRTSPESIKFMFYSKAAAH